MPDVLSVWTVFDHPQDFPQGYVARRFEITGDGAPVPTRDVVVGDSLDVIRDYMMMRGLACMSRDDDDAMYIVESWL